MTATYEIYEREPGQRLAGHLALRVDGNEAFFTCDPSQFLPKSLAAALKAGAEAGAAATQAAQVIAKEYARRSLQRVIEKLRSGRRNPGGGALTRSTAGDSMGDFVARAVAGLTASEKAAAPAGDEQAAIHWFLTRGKLASASDARRAEMLKHRDQLTDREVEQRIRRARLKRYDEWIGATEKRLKELPAESDLRPGLESRLARYITERESLKVSIVCASHGFQYAYGQYMQGAVDLVNDDIRAFLLSTDTTVDTERDAMDAFGDFATVDEFDGSGYTAGGLALDSQAVNIDDANDRAEFDAADEAATLGAGTRSIAGIAIGKFVTNTAGSLPLHWLEFSSAKTPDGSLFTIQWNAEGIIQAADAS